MRASKTREEHLENGDDVREEKMIDDPMCTLFLIRGERAEINIAGLSCSNARHSRT